MTSFECAKLAAKESRLLVGTALVSPADSHSPLAPNVLFGELGNLNQGDHVGIEIATRAHEQLLQTVGFG